MILVRTRGELRERLSAMSEAPTLVPTMGALHEGHLSLVDRAAEGGRSVAVSVFVNPIQFGPGEDLERYPRDLEGDLDLLESRGVALVFAPTEEEMYPEGRPIVTVDPGPLGDRLCGRSRPGHFRGVLTVVARLFSLFRPAAAVFGRKDLQQSVLVRRMVDDLALGVEIQVAPIVREADGLAMSSRNALLPPDARSAASVLHRGLTAGIAAFRRGERTPSAILERARAVIAEEPAVQLEYLELVRTDSLETPDAARVGDAIALAAHCGGVRLIDNDLLEMGSPGPADGDG